MPDMRQFIQNIQKSRGLSVAELASLLGYKSQTSVARIMQDKANVDSVSRFCQLMQENENLALTDEETETLNRILERKKLGQVVYAATDILRQLLREDPPLVDPLLVDAGTGKKTSLLERYMPLDDVRMTVLNCETVPVFAALAKLTSLGKAWVEHILYSDAALLRTVMTVQCVLPILHQERYNGGIAFAERGFILNNPRGILMADVMLCEYELKGQPQYDLVLFQSRAEGMLFTFPGKADTVHRMMESLRDKVTPIRNAGVPSLRDGYADYLRYCCGLEKDRAIYRIKPDFGMEQVPAEIWIRAFLEGPLAGDSSAIGDFQELADLVRLRESNTLAKKQAQHHVFKQRAVWKFVRTGRLSDQFWAFRPLTMAERLQTLQAILRRHEENPYFQMHFLKDEDGMRDDEIICYEGVGVTFVKAGTDYNLNSAHSEFMVTQPEFLRLYRNFYLHSILPYDVQPEYKTRKILMEMIEYCQSNLEA